MNISKALKLKNRLAGDVSKLQDIARRENSRRSDNLSQIDVDNVFGSLKKTSETLALLKASISRASAPIAIKLAFLSELKNYVNWISGLPTREGEEKVSYGHSSEVEVFKWTAYLNRQALDLEIANIQTKINNLQDEIDDFNSSTTIDLVVPNTEPLSEQASDSVNVGFSEAPLDNKEEKHS